MKNLWKYVIITALISVIITIAMKSAYESPDRAMNHASMYSYVVIQDNQRTNKQDMFIYVVKWTDEVFKDAYTLSKYYNVHIVNADKTDEAVENKISIDN